MTETLLEVRGLTRSYGRLRAVDDVSFEMGRGKIYGFIGDGAEAAGGRS